MLPLQSSVLMCFAKNLLEGKISAGSSKKRQSTDTAVRYVVPQSTSCKTRMPWHHPIRLSQVRGCSQEKTPDLKRLPTEKTPDFFCTNVVLQNHQCRNRSVPLIRASHSRTCSCPTRSYACLPRSAAV